MNKHLEKIFEKLGVETRSAATALASKLLVWTGSPSRYAHQSRLGGHNLSDLLAQHLRGKPAAYAQVWPYCQKLQGGLLTPPAVPDENERRSYWVC